MVAARVGLLTNSPLTKADIMVGSSQVPANRMVTTPNSASVRRLIRMRNIVPGEDPGERRRPQAGPGLHEIATDWPRYDQPR